MLKLGNMAVNLQFTAAVNGHHEGLFNSTKMLNSGQPVFYTHVSIINGPYLRSWVFKLD